MDADNAVYPTALARMSAALRDDEGAAAAYTVLEDFGAQRNIRSALAWDVERMCAANYIDAQAMWRRSAWVALGGYRDDDDLVYGWEDWDLWLRLAAQGGRAVLVPEILGRYRVQAGSMIALTNLATDDAIDAIARIAFDVNATVENIGARRLQTVMEKLLEEISFEAEDRKGETLTIDAAYVSKQLSGIAKDTDLSKYVL
jgi:hypothetical protein